MDKNKNQKTIAIRLPQHLADMLSDYSKAQQTQLASFARFAIYETAFRRLSSDRSRLAMMKDALERLEMSDDQKLEQKREIKDLEAWINRFQELAEELGYTLYDNEGGENA